MTNEYEWFDSYDNPRTEYSIGNTLLHKFSVKIGVSALSILAVFAINVPLAHSQGGPADFTVNCNQGDSIQDALDQASDGNRIKVVGGTCSENIVIKLDHLTLDGVGNPTIDGSGGEPDSNTIRVLGTNVTITGFTVTGGHDHGIDIRGSSSANISDCTVNSSGRSGIFVTLSSHANVNDSTSEDNGTDGVFVRGSSSASLQNNTMRGNGDDGLSVQFSSFVNLVGPNTFEGNADDGVQCSGSSGLRVGAIQVFSGNGGNPTALNCTIQDAAGDPNF